MGVRPPSNDLGDEPEQIEFGIVELDARIDERNISFPATTEQLTTAYGELEIAVDAAGHTMTLSTALSQCQRDAFDSKQDLLDALHPIFEQKRQSVSGSVLGRLRSLFPF